MISYFFIFDIDDQSNVFIQPELPKLKSELIAAEIINRISPAKQFVDQKASFPFQQFEVYTQKCSSKILVGALTENALDKKLFLYQIFEKTYGYIQKNEKWTESNDFFSFNSSLINEFNSNLHGNRPIMELISKEPIAKFSISLFNKIDIDEEQTINDKIQKEQDNDDPIDSEKKQMSDQDLKTEIKSEIGEKSELNLISPQEIIPSWNYSKGKNPFLDSDENVQKSFDQEKGIKLTNKEIQLNKNREKESEMSIIEIKKQNLVIKTEDAKYQKNEKRDKTESVSRNDDENEVSAKESLSAINLRDNQQTSKMYLVEFEEDQSSQIEIPLFNDEDPYFQKKSLEKNKNKDSLLSKNEQSTKKISSSRTNLKSPRSISQKISMQSVQNEKLSKKFLEKKKAMREAEKRKNTISMFIFFVGFILVGVIMIMFYPRSSRQ